MAQAASMGPPLSPRETRRSGRRSAHSASTSTSKSPDSDVGSRAKEPLPQRPPLVTHNSGSRGRRTKEEDFDDFPNDRKSANHAPSNASSSSTHSTANGRSRRKTKDKANKPPSSDDPVDVQAMSTDERPLDPADDEDEEQGVTRCICGNEDPPRGEDEQYVEFMVQCETCKVWQHGFCMGYESEGQVPDDDYYCEECRPDLHTELLKKQNKKRHSSTTSHHPVSATSRLSRSHSPTFGMRQTAKRRNTMNSTFDESLKQILETTAAEAGATRDPLSISVNGTNAVGYSAEPEEDQETASANRKKRRRAEDESAPSKKRTRSMSTTSDNPTTASHAVRDDTPLPAGSSKAPSMGPPPPPPKSTKNKRGGKKAAALEHLALDGLEGPAPRVKGSRKGGAKRTPNSTAHGSASGDHGRRQTNGVNGQGTNSAYRNSHSYSLSQQPMYTSWGLPDHLAHLESMLPSITPEALEVPGGRAASEERTMERGVKVKWPSKRTSVPDMNKRVRALVEWVGREQANAMDRERRKLALDQALKEAVAGDANGHTNAMEVDPQPSTDEPAAQDPIRARSVGPPVTKTGANSDSSATMKLMEELMTELITFQERFGPGAKSRERRTATAS